MPIPVMQAEAEFKERSTMKKALILYASMSGNTEKIAHAFEEVFKLYGFEVDLYKAEGKKLSEKNWKQKALQ